jgi:hypothetical protein
MDYYINVIIDNYEAELQKVKQNGNVLYYIKEQTPELCLAAVQQYGWALDYVKEQTPEICLAAVKQCGTDCLYNWSKNKRLYFV